MHPYLTRLGIRSEVQRFFRPFYTSDALGNLVFAYGEAAEHFGFAFHKVPVTDGFWFAGNLAFSQVRLVILSASALDAVSWLNKKLPAFPQTENLLFVALGAGISDAQLLWIGTNFANKQVRLLFGRDLLGRIADLKLAAAIKGWPLSVYLGQRDQLIIYFRNRHFVFRREQFSLAAFERVAGVRFGVATDKPKVYPTFFDELKAEAGL
ncbi:hypothetical protein SNE25_13060 [Mucilaginibacter sabulilitoris]|uniref:Uncharacterized protein n=1 Tax=Mucilaginibacter sabulilitoris TaxID=1173583 RepID=A0ABZ0TTL9_9SPHI|nr:hypothetical protein [Mucilaginibacter sabulilitoris]WPU96450.1 hypothetical protein SNE25_13060 [Mucilaginibacter sabulilitoris]